jgi:HK97 family phage portal protein
MGVLDVLRGRGITRAAADDGGIDVTRPVTPPDGNIAPTLAAQLAAPPGVDLWFDWTYGCLTPETAMKVPAVRRGVRTIADSIADMQLTRWRGLEQIPSGTLLTQPEMWRPSSATIRQTVQDLVFYPYAWWKVTERDWTGFPSHVVRLDPAYVTVDTELVSDEVDWAAVTYRGNVVPQQDLIRFDGPDDGVLRLGTIEILTALKLELAARTYADPEIPTGVLTNTGQYKLDQAERTQLMDDWAAARRRHSTAYLDANLTYQPVLAMPDQLQLVQSREESAVQVARLLNLPPHYVGAKSGDSMTYSTVASERRDLVDISLAPYISAIEDRLSMSDRNGSPIGQTVRFDMANLLRSDAREDAEVGEILIRSGQSTADEQRARRGLPPLGAVGAPVTPATEETPT